MPALHSASSDTFLFGPPAAAFEDASADHISGGGGGGRDLIQVESAASEAINRIMEALKEKTKDFSTSDGTDYAALWRLLEEQGALTRRNGTIVIGSDLGGLAGQQEGPGGFGLGRNGPAGDTASWGE